MNIISKLTHPGEWARYLREMPDYLRGYARAQTAWGDEMYVPFPEFRCIVETGYLDEGTAGIYGFLDKHLTGKDVFFDIGANAGYYTLFAAHKGAQAHSFEPFPTMFELLKKNAALHPNYNIHLYEVAVSSVSGMLAMQKGVRPGLNHVTAEGDVSVRSVRLDDLSVAPTMMKVDVEGHEPEVIKGAQQMIRTHLPAVIVESVTDIEEFMFGLGYHKRLLGDNEHSSNTLFIR